MIDHPGTITFTSENPDRSFSVLAGETTPQTTSGYGGYETRARPRRRPLTSWVGFPALTIEVPILFDAFSDRENPELEPAGKSIERDIATLELMAGRGKGGGKHEPPRLTLDGPGNLIPPSEDIKWVIEDIAWGDALVNSRGNRIRQAATVTLLQYVRDNSLHAVSVANRRRATHRRRRRTYRWREGDTLRKVAKKLLGDPGDAKKLRKANPKIHDWRHLKAGTTIKVPRD